MAAVSRKEEVCSDYSGMVKKLLPSELTGDFECLDSCLLGYRVTTNSQVVSVLLFVVVEDSVKAKLSESDIDLS